MPTWRQGQSVGQWRQVAGTALSSAPMAVVAGGNTGPASKVITWNGFSIDTRDSSVYSVANGGHSDYAGNEVDRIRLLDNAPAWTEARAATPMSQVIANTSHYADGRPTSRHTYYGTVFSEQRGRAMVLGGARYGDGYAHPAFDAFNPAVSDWDTAGTFPDVPRDFVTVSNSALTPQKSTGDIFLFANYNVWKWSNATNTWSNVLGNGIMGYYSASALDTQRNRILVQGGDQNAHHVYDIAANTLTPITFTGPAASALGPDGGNGMVYDPALDAYLLRKRDAGGTIYRINAQTFSVDTVSISGGDQIPAAQNGVWTKFLYVPQLKGVVFFPSYTGDAWFLRTW